jgi:hypothetical protein
VELCNLVFKGNSTDSNAEFDLAESIIAAEINIAER